MSSSCKTCVVVTNQKATGVRTSMTRTTDSTPRNGSARNPGSMVASVPWARPTKEQRSMPSPSATLPTSRRWFPAMRCPTTDALPAAKRAAADPAAAKALVEMGDQARDYVRALPLRPGTTPLKFAPDYESWLIEAMSHGDYDDFWKNSGASVVDHLAEYKDVPEYHTTGWYDSWGTQVANINFVELRRTKKSLQRLIVGPWIHSSEELSYAGEAQFTDDAALDLTAFHL